MVIDTSAITAILRSEPEAARLSTAIEGDPMRIMSVANWLETHMVIEGRLGMAGGATVEMLIRRLHIEIVSEATLGSTALNAWQRFGKGNHAARLNLGDCFAYATAILRNQPLLFKGGDFDKTDVRRVAY
jgi:ribonuclease VapC